MRSVCTGPNFSPEAVMAEKALTSPINVCQVEVHSKDWQRLLGERARVHGAQAKREDAGK